ncbi:hypothetical protein DQ04_03711050 [Trypanosoma grayi]|uniref:hypothetical protein n=1 Tax=Trypanosoma grayi TaxID=71804 RepID=UPI0004F41B7F|nr:hypothetical protein DQ04_03711050 [Trypanosoma grayi]KEG10443.1 hypothetical protein DQ04_03711050 [Trypanosoma grayi]
MAVGHTRPYKNWRTLLCRCVTPDSVRGTVGSLNAWLGCSVSQGQARHRALALLLIVAFFLSYTVAAASSSSSSSSRGMTSLGYYQAASDSPTQGPLAIITNCFPDVVLCITNITYFCVIDNTAALMGRKLRVSYYFEGMLNGGWPATLIRESNLIRFVPNTAATPGRADIVITTTLKEEFPVLLPLTSKWGMQIIDNDATETVFYAPAPYYGQRVTWHTNFPKSNSVESYLLVKDTNSFSASCDSCTPEIGCYNVTITRMLPPPGNYSLCIGASGWRNKCLPWGHSPLEVRLLVPSLLYLTAGKEAIVELRDLKTGELASDTDRLFLVACPGNDCPRVGIGNGEEVVRLDACANEPPSKPVYLFSGSVMPEVLGTYALCAERDLTGITLGAFPIIVVKEPFAITVISISKNWARVEVSGGDLPNRTVPCLVCASSTPITPTSSSNLRNVCNSSALLYDSFVDLDVSMFNVGQVVRFVVFGASVTLAGNSHNFVVADGSAVVSDHWSPSGEDGDSIALVVGVALVLLAVVSAIAVFIFFYWRRQLKNMRAGFHAENQSREALSLLNSHHASTEDLAVAAPPPPSSTNMVPPADVGRSHDHMRCFCAKVAATAGSSVAVGNEAKDSSEPCIGPSVHCGVNGNGEMGCSRGGEAACPCFGRTVRPFLEDAYETDVRSCRGDNSPKGTHMSAATLLSGRDCASNAPQRSISPSDAAFTSSPGTTSYEAAHPREWRPAGFPTHIKLSRGNQQGNTSRPPCVLMAFASTPAENTSAESRVMFVVDEALQPMSGAVPKYVLVCADTASGIGASNDKCCRIDLRTLVEHHMDREKALPRGTSHTKSPMIPSENDSYRASETKSEARLSQHASEITALYDLNEWRSTSSPSTDILPAEEPLPHVIRVENFEWYNQTEIGDFLTLSGTETDTLPCGSSSDDTNDTLSTES